MCARNLSVCTVILLLEIFTKTYTDIRISAAIIYPSFHSFTVRPILLYLYLIFIAVMGAFDNLSLKKMMMMMMSLQNALCHLPRVRISVWLGLGLKFG